MDKGFHGKKLPHTTELFNLAGNYNKNQQLEAKTRHIPAENKVQIIKIRMTKLGNKVLGNVGLFVLQV